MVMKDLGARCPGRPAKQRVGVEKTEEPVTWKEKYGLFQVLGRCFRSGHHSSLKSKHCSCTEV